MPESTVAVVVVYLSDANRAADLVESIGNMPSVGTIKLNPHWIANLDDLYTLSKSHWVDYLVIDHQFRGFFTGLDIVERLYGHSHRPETILLASVTDELRQHACQLGISTVLSSTCPIENVRRSLAELVQKSQRISIPEAVERMLGRFPVAESMPPIFFKLATYLEDKQEPSEAEWIDSIAGDATITAALVDAAINVAGRTGDEIKNVADVVDLFGLHRSLSLAVTSSVCRIVGAMHPRKRQNEYYQWYNNRFLLTAAAAAAFGEQLEEISPNTAFMLGAIQDIGIAVLLGASGSRYNDIIRRFALNGRLYLEAVETSNFGFTHADVSTAVLQRWGAPDSLVSIVHAHQQRELVDGAHNVEFLRVMRIGEALANLTNRRHSERHRAFEGLFRSYRNVSENEILKLVRRSAANAGEVANTLALDTLETSFEDAIAAQLIDGSTTVVKTKVTQQTGAQSAVAKNEHAKNKKRPVVLLVDDEPFVVNLITTILSSVGLDVASCDSREKAAQLAKDAVAALVDVHLREESGIDVIRDLRTGGFAKPIIVVSGDRRREVIELAVKAGLTDYLIKPFDSDTLISKLRVHTGLPLTPVVR